MTRHPSTHHCHEDTAMQALDEPHPSMEIEILGQGPEPGVEEVQPEAEGAYGALIGEAAMRGLSIVPAADGAGIPAEAGSRIFIEEGRWGGRAGRRATARAALVAEPGGIPVFTYAFGRRGRCARRRPREPGRRRSKAANLAVARPGSGGQPGSPYGPGPRHNPARALLSQAAFTVTLEPALAWSRARPSARLGRVRNAQPPATVGRRPCPLGPRRARRSARQLRRRSE